MEDHAFTDEQLVAIERRDGDLLLDASAGSGKTSVLVERFARSVLEDGIEVSAILTITFTEKAAAEMRDRIRRRLRELGADEAARATEGAFISTIHGFCARVLRAHALAAGLDPAFGVLDAPDAERIADDAFADALEELGREAPAPAAIDLIAAYGAGRAACRDPADPRRAALARRAAPAVAGGGAGAGARRGSRDELERAGAAALAELAAIPDPGAKVLQAIGRLERLPEVIDVRGAVARRPVGRRASGRERRRAVDRGLRALRARRWPRSGPRASTAGRRGRTTCSTGCCACSRALRAGQARGLGARLRGPRARMPRAPALGRRAPRPVPGPLCPDHGRRAPGHQPGAARADRADREREPVHGRRRSAVDLRVPPRRRRAVRAARRAAGRERRAGDARHELPLAPGDPERDQRRVRDRARRAVPAAAPGARRRRGGGRRRRAARGVARRRQGRGLGDGGARGAVAGGRGAGAGGPRRAAARGRHRPPATSCC